MNPSKITIETILAIRLVSHGLLTPAFLTGEDVVAQLGAMQAQDFNMAKWAIGIRMPNGREQTIVEAFNKGEILRTHVLRPTWHFVAPENIRWLLSLTADRIKAAANTRDRELGITETLYEKVNHIMVDALKGNRCLTREAISEILIHSGITVDNARMYHFMMRAEVEAIVCSGALQGKKQTYALLDERVPPTNSHADLFPASREEALAKLARIYFTSHAPATLQDFIWWSGLSTADARKGLNDIKQNFVEKEIVGQIYFVLANREEFVSDMIFNTNKAFLLPAFDEYIISYCHRNIIISSERCAKVISSNGIFRPVIVMNGKVIGTWRKTALKSKPLTFEYFEQPDKLTRKAVEDAGEKLKTFYFDTI
ncbi:MAG: winged helix DNA-binding domain-containing protein [Bacteroidales bacterium]|jgi:hypothetical protein|nr:winged helix DNA-binding domain-containing protein [Bacteroidales bacterium]